MKKLLIRLQLCWCIITRKYDHWVVINLDEANLRELLKENDFECDAKYHGIQPYILYKMIDRISKTKDETDMFLEKMAFEAEAGIINN